MTDILPIERLSVAWRLLADGVRMPDHVRDAIVDSVFYWWEKSPDPTVADELTGALSALSASAAAGQVAAKLRPLVETGAPEAVERVLRLLDSLPAQGGSALQVLTDLIVHTEGPVRWSAATQAARLGLHDSLILAHLSGLTAIDLATDSPNAATAGWSGRERFRVLYSQLAECTTNRERGSTLEALAECFFLGVPGIQILSRNLRTQSDEIDLAFANRGDGFWSDVGDPFIVECKNRDGAVSASMVRDLIGKLRTHGLRGAFLVTTTHISKDARVEIRQAHGDGRIVTAVEREHLASAAADGEPSAILQRCFYAFRLL